MEKAFNGEVTSKMKGDDGRIMHATVQIGDSIIMVSDVMKGMNEPMPTMLYLYVDDVDAMYRQAIDANGTSIREPIDEFYGDRSAGVKDEWNNQWWVATHVEDMSDAEMERRKEEFLKKGENMSHCITLEKKGRAYVRPYFFISANLILASHIFQYLGDR